MNWSVFFAGFAFILLLGGLTWYSETNRHNESLASFCMILGALILVILGGIHL